MTLHDTLPDDAARPTYYDWRTTLARAVGRATLQPVSPGMAVQRLAQLPSAALIALDRAIRSEVARTFRSVPIGGLAHLRLDGPSDEVDALLFLHACDPNGYVRGHAVALLRDRPGRLACAALLIRCGDWVEPVRNAAVDALADLVARGDGARLFAHLDLLLPLRAHRRIAERAWPQLIVPALADPRFAAQRLDAVWRGSTQTRLFALDLATTIDPAAVAGAFERAASDDNAPVARWAVQGAEPLAFLQRIAQPALRSRHASVRAAALRRLASLDAPDLRATLESHTFDAAREPRNAARFLLHERYGVDALVAWRAALDAPESRRALIALEAMREHATLDDVARVERFLTAPRARARIAALDAFVRMRAPALGECLAAALRDPSRRVVRNAIDSYRRAHDVPAPHVLRDAYANAAADSMRMVLARALDLVGKWNAIEFVVDWCAQAPAPLPPYLRQAYGDCMRLATQRFGGLDATGKARIAASLERAQVRHAAFSFEDVENLLRFA